MELPLQHARTTKLTKRGHSGVGILGCLADRSGLRKGLYSSRSIPAMIQCFAQCRHDKTTGRQVIWWQPLQSLMAKMDSARALPSQYKGVAINCGNMPCDMSGFFIVLRQLAAHTESRQRIFGVLKYRVKPPKLARADNSP